MIWITKMGGDMKLLAFLLSKTIKSLDIMTSWGPIKISPRGGTDESVLGYSSL